MNRKSRTRLISLSLTLLIVFALMVAGPVSAVRVGLSDFSSTTPTQGDSVSFVAYVDIETDERIPVQNITLEINGTTNSTTCIFDVQGNNLTACSGITITKLTHVPYGYDYGYMFGYGYGYGYPNYQWEYYNATFFGYGYGYSYGYGYDYTTSYYGELAYNITWDTTGFEAGDYTIYLDAYAISDNKYYKFSSRDTVNLVSVSTTTTTTTSTTTTTLAPSGGYTTSPSVTEYSSTEAGGYVGRAYAGETKAFDMSKAKDLGVTSIDITFAKDVTNVRITVKNLGTEKPADVTSPIGVITSSNGLVYAYLKIDCSISNDAISSATIKFKVPVKWITDYNINPDTIALSRFADNKWTKLTTTKVSSDAEYYYYEATTTGFSVFAITAEPISVVPTTTTIPAVTTTTIPTVTTTVPVTTTTLPGVIPGVSYLTWIIVIIVILVLAVLYWKRDVLIKKK